MTASNEANIGGSLILFSEDVSVAVVFFFLSFFPGK